MLAVMCSCGGALVAVVCSCGWRREATGIMYLPPSEPYTSTASGALPVPSRTVPTAAVLLSASDCGTDGARSSRSQVPFDTRADDAQAHTPICLGGVFHIWRCHLNDDGGVFLVGERASEVLVP